MSRVNREGLDPDFIASAEAMLGQKPVEQQDYGHAAYFVEERVHGRRNGL